MHTFNLFTYGTLKAKETFRRFCPAPCPAEPATLMGYTKYAVQGAFYPAVIKDDTGEVDGILWRDIPRECLVSFDAYEAEGHLYHRREVQVNGVPAYVYVWGRARTCLSPQPIT